MKELLCNILDEYGASHYYYGIKKYDLCNRIIIATEFLDKKSEMKERFYCILHDIKNTPKCKVNACGQKPKFKNISAGYHQFCSSKCNERYKRETLNEDGIFISNVIGMKIRSDKSRIMENGKTKGQNARDKQLKKQMEIEPISGLTYTKIIAKKGINTLIEKNLLKLRGQKIKNVKIHNVDVTGKNGYDRAVESMSKTKKMQYQLLQIENASDIDNCFLYFFVNDTVNVIKIGISKNYESRKKYLENKVGHKLMTYDVYFGNHKEVMKAEYRLHSLMDHGQIKYSCVDGKWEWFKYDYFEKNKCKIMSEIKKFNLRKI